MQRKEGYRIKVMAPAGEMWAVRSTKKHGHASDEDSHAEKRCRIDSECSDSDNPLGVSIEGHTHKSSGWTCLTWPALTDPEPEILDIASFKVNANANATKDGTDNYRNNTSATSKISIDTVKIDTPEELHTRLQGKLFVFKLHEVKRIMRWMKLTRTYKITDHKDDFIELLAKLGYTDPRLCKKDQDALKTKTRAKLFTLNANFRRAGAINEAEGYESSGSNAPLVFAEWTNAWLKPGWDGSHLKPTKENYEKAMNAKDGDSVGENGADREFYENDLKLIVMSPLPDEPEGAPDISLPGEAEGGADPNPWYNAELNKEIIANSDWNSRVIAAQHLGHHLPGTAMLQDDPFPGYEPAVPAPSVTSEPPINPTTSHTEIPPPASPTAPTTPKPRGLTIKFNISPTTIADSDSDGSVSLGDADSHPDPETPKHITIVDEETAYEADEESEDDSLESNTEISAGTAPTSFTTEPTTPVRKTKHQASTPRTPLRPTTPGGHFVTWTPDS